MKDCGIRYLANESYAEKVKPEYKEILKLDKMLDVAGIYHELVRNWDGWEIIYYGHGEEKVSDAIEHHGSYGEDADLLEIMGLTDDGYDVQGYLSAKDVFDRWSKHWEETAGEC